MGLKHVIFDWDGTLAKTLDLWLLGYQVAFESRGHRFEPEVITKEFFHNHRDVPAKYPELGFPEIAEETRAFVFDGLLKVELYEGAADTLDRLKVSGRTLTLVTSSARHIIDRALDTHGLGDFFDSVIAGDDGFGHKPSPVPFETTLARIGAPASEALVVGDSHVDIQAGQAIGCRTCWFAPEHNSLFHDFAHVKTLSPDHEIAAVEELIELT